MKEGKRSGLTALCRGEFSRVFTSNQDALAAALQQSVHNKLSRGDARKERQFPALAANTLRLKEGRKEGGKDVGADLKLTPPRHVAPYCRGSGQAAPL